MLLEGREVSRVIGNSDEARHLRPAVIGPEFVARGTDRLDRRETTVGAAALLAALFIPSPGRAASPDKAVSAAGASAESRRRDGSGIAGVVRTRDRRGVGGIVVMVEKLDPPPVPIPELANSTDRDGRFFWSLPRGHYRLRFVRDGRTIAERVVRVASDETAEEIDVEIGENTWR